MRQLTLLLLLLVLLFGGCAITVRSLQPTVDTATQTLIAAEIRTDPIDDLVRFREAERDGRSATHLLPIFVLLTAVLLFLALTAPLPHILKELRLMRKGRSHPRSQQSAVRPSPWIESPTASQLPPYPPYPLQPPPSLPELPPPQPTGWLEE